MKNVADPGVGDVNVPVCRCLIKEDCITVLRTLGIGEFGVVQHAVWTKDTAQQVWLSVCLSVCMFISLVFLACCLHCQYTFIWFAEHLGCGRLGGSVEECRKCAEVKHTD